MGRTVKTNVIHIGYNFQHPAFKGSAVNVLVPDMTGDLQSFCKVYKKK